MKKLNEKQIFFISELPPMKIDKGDRRFIIKNGEVVKNENNN